MSKHSEAVAAHAREMGHTHVRSSHEHGHETHTEHYPAGHYPAAHNAGEEHKVLDHNLDDGEQTHDSPVPTEGRQMPHKDITTKAQEVASEMHRHGEGDGFAGVMNR
jgi:hypothetical protein